MEAGSDQWSRRSRGEHHDVNRGWGNTENFEEEEWCEPRLRRIDGNRINYASRGLEDFSDFVVCDFDYAVFGEKKYTGEAMPDLYHAPELVLRTT